MSTSGSRSVSGLAARSTGGGKLRSELAFQFAVQVIERLDEFSNAVVFQFLAHGFKVDPELLEFTQSFSRVVKLVLQFRRGIAVVAKGRERFRRHRVDCIASDERLHVTNITFFRTFSARTGPKHALGASAR